MKLSRKEIFSLKLNKDELIFLVNVINKIKLDQNSSEEAIQMLNRFKKLFNQENEKQVESPQAEDIRKYCEVCDTVEFVETRVNPLAYSLPGEEMRLDLCYKCYVARQKTATDFDKERLEGRRKYKNED